MEGFNTKKERPKFESTSGWILPNGDFMECRFHRHNFLANKMGTTERDLERTAMKISQDEKDHIKSFRGRPHFIPPQEGNLTKEQLDTLEEYCFFMKFFHHQNIFLNKKIPQMKKIGKITGRR